MNGTKRLAGRVGFVLCTALLETLTGHTTYAAVVSVNVGVSMTIAPDGSAQSVSASGDELSVAKCIENDVRGWRFPAMGCSQKTSFSFKFVRQ